LEKGFLKNLRFEGTVGKKVIYLLKVISRNLELKEAMFEIVAGGFVQSRDLKI
jgi:hypothetical protein